MNTTAEMRRALVARLFPAGVNRLWCPMIVQYGAEGEIDIPRMEAHLCKMFHAVRCFLVFGSTGDGWELQAQEKRQLIAAYGDWAKRYGIKLLLGVLQPEMNASYTEMREWIQWAQETTGLSDATEAMLSLGICGFTACAPRGATLSQAVIHDELAKMLDLGVPMALYQLPQITENEIAPETIAALAEKYFNFFLFKDTSGEDRVIRSGLDFGGVFFVRGAEGDYCQWYKGAGGYDGFLLSSANCFGDQLLHILNAIDGGRTDEAQQLSAAVARAIDRVFANCAPLEGGNVFANANKCIDHCQAYGDAWEQAALPMRHCGQRIPKAYVAEAAEALKGESWFIHKGYMAEARPELVALEAKTDSV